MLRGANSHGCQYVAQSDLEKFLGASTGKYTIGLGQTNMSFCDDREGMNSSIALTKNH
jgi:hydroxymethylglutaryl-CoA synthase